MRGEEAAAMLPEPRPDAFAVGLRNVQAGQRGAREELKPAFAHRRWERFQFRLQLEQKHEPVRLTLKTMFAHQSREMEIRRQEFQPKLLVRFAGGADVGGFPEVSLEFAAARTPEPAIRLLCAFEQEEIIPFVKAVEQRGDFVRQLHAQSEPIAARIAKRFVGDCWDRDSPPDAAPSASARRRLRGRGSKGESQRGIRFSADGTPADSPRVQTGLAIARRMAKLTL